ncbi:retron St85 family RNA-directed DNA polymerase [Salinisphaera sp.]|uniref:retron St85 family RNA-directed DNA polymerase n=1 Tax=Salinisphaera sp. TaxID=1914330 RepID=UPI000C4180C2|nr:retron St85 family RNA-directed DNA polymerase [Salinisphaera sp.]MBS63438.1 RNA-dependent DNA polymerase [Salinisphaera sp.]
MKISESQLFGRMCQDLSLQSESLKRIISTAPLRYKKFRIPKRSGGWREVAQPAREVKKLQYWIIRELGDILPVSDHATAYRDSISIKNNALVHDGSNYLLKMDFASFFPSIKFSDLSQHLSKYVKELTADDIGVIALTTLWTPNREPPLRLCIGAPSSPLLSNSILFDFDALVSKSLPDSVKYTRYADDLFFSTQESNQLSYVERLVRETVHELAYPALSFNDNKTVNVSRNSRRSVTGVVLKPDGGLSVGRERKRIARAMCHKLSIGRLSADEEAKLRGLLAFISSIEPRFAERLKSKYSI